VDARKKRFTAEAIWDLLYQAKTIITMKGKKVQRWNPMVDDKSTILQHVIGPSGNLRAPTYRIKNKFIVGFNQEFYEQWMQGE